MKAFSFIIWIVYLLFALIHLYACHQNKDSLRRKTKPALMPLLALAYVASVWRDGGGVDPLVPFALLCGAAGDMLLLPKSERRLLMMGAGAFLMGHLVYIYLLIRLDAIAMLSVGQALRLSAYALPAYLLWGVILMRAIWRGLDQWMRRLLPIYAAILEAMSLIAVTGMLSPYGGVANVILSLGSILFVVSDSALAFRLFRRKEGEREGRFFVMLTYILAQTLLVSGFIIP